MLKKIPAFANDRARLVRQTLEIGELLNELSEAFSNSPTEVSEQQRQYIHALLAIVKYLDKVSGSREAGSPFFALAVRFQDLNAGLKNKLLQPRSGRGRRHDTTEVWFQRGEAAFAVERLVRKAKADGVELTVKEAAKKIAAESPNLKAITRRGASLITSIENWHKDFMQGAVKNLLAQGEFNLRFPLAHSAEN